MRQLDDYRSLDTPTSDIREGKWEVEANRTSLQFVAHHLLVAKVRGWFRACSGTILTGNSPFGAEVVATAETASLDTGDPVRDAYLLSETVLDAEQWPRLHLTGTIVDRTSLGYLLLSELTVRDVTRTVTFDVLVLGRTVDVGRERLTVTAYTTISRKKFGLVWNPGLESANALVGDGVDVALTVTATRNTDYSLERGR